MSARLIIIRPVEMLTHLHAIKVNNLGENVKISGNLLLSNLFKLLFGIVDEFVGGALTKYIRKSAGLSVRTPFRTPGNHFGLPFEANPADASPNCHRLLYQLPWTALRTECAL